ncbi:MAG TPA: divalent cation tolerance protein CutA [Saprospiraceae bacterium]|nr:divalent cation tolerance protein CutA [Saprospiraceae bacterium]
MYPLPALIIAKTLVEQKLAACVQLMLIESVYRWEGKVQYEVPELIATTIEWGLPAYLAWMKEGTH